MSEVFYRADRTMASDPVTPLRPIGSRTITAETCLQLLRRSITLLRCGFTPVYALLGRFLPKLKAASGRPPFWRCLPGSPNRDARSNAAHLPLLPVQIAGTLL